jgi:hypothetical protein
MKSIALVRPRWLLGALAASCLFGGGQANASQLFIASLPTEVSGPQSLLEGVGFVNYTVHVTNNTGTSLLLDMAMVTTVPSSGDLSDNISFPTVISFPAVIATGDVGVFVYQVQTLTPPVGDDFGVTPFSFSVEYSALIGNAGNTPTTNLVPGAAILLGGPSSGNIDPDALTGLLTGPNSCFANPALCPLGPQFFLYPSDRAGNFAVFGGYDSLPVSVFDVPEPSTWGLMLIGFAGLGLALRRRRGQVAASFAR